ncbi:hypothetical protein GGX14DRAFT_400583 [Mycena pura]|uniref:MYND-type domain-containing protein n=1 Tax=Mycena pura TaxID=153505 RepID=A0AAD6V5V7_9AGAR|nr:hypothetical protein GGX14DRAFT_400583 [Mycena pura]
MSFYHPDMEAIDYEPSAALIDAIMGQGDYDEDDLYYGSDDGLSGDYLDSYSDGEYSGSEDSNSTRFPPDDLRNPKSFPSFAECAPIELYDRRDWDNKPLPPPRHWCYLGQIVKHITAPIRNLLTVKDKAGKQTELSTKFDLEAEFDVKVGSTIAILYAERKYLSFGVYGLRLDEAKFVKIFPCDLETLLRINDDIENETPIGSAKKCSGCGKGEEPNKAALLRCSRCLGVSYCGKECQTAAWKRGHKRECKVFSAVLELKRSRSWANKKPRQWVAFGEREEQSPPSDDGDSADSDDYDDSYDRIPYRFQPEWKDTKPAVVRELQGTFTITSGELLWGQPVPLLSGLMTTEHDFASSDDKAVMGGTIHRQGYTYRAPARVGVWKLAKVNGFGDIDHATDSWFAYHSSCDPLALLLLARPVQWDTRTASQRVCWVNRYDWGYHCANAYLAARFFADVDAESGWGAAYKRQRALQDAGGDPDNARWERLEAFDSHNAFLVDAAEGAGVLKLLARPSELDKRLKAHQASSFFKGEDSDVFGCHLPSIGNDDWEFARLIFSEEDSPLFAGKKELVGFWYDQDNRYKDSEVDRGTELKTPVIKNI